jgi:hypothetical protein
MKASFVGFLRISITIAALVGYCSADDECRPLLEHGIFDQLSESRTSNSRSTATSELCRTYHEYQSDTKTGNASAKYYQVFDGSVSLSDTQVKSIGEWMCDSKYSDFSADSFAALNKSIISTSAVSAWQACVTQDKFISVKTTYHDTDQGSEGVTLAFYRSGSSKDTNTEQINWIKTSPNLTCQGGVLNPLINPPAVLPQAATLGSATLSLDCTRMTLNEPTRAGSRDVYADSSFITINTSAGDIVRAIPAILPPPPPPAVPRGTIVAWSPAGASGPPTGWVTCDGKNGTPDLRDRFLKGTVDFSHAGEPGGSNQQTVTVSVPSLQLTVGGGKLGSMWADKAGEVYHFTGNAEPDKNVINSFTLETKASGTVDNQPAFISIIYIMKL